MTTRAKLAATALFLLMVACAVSLHMDPPSPPADTSYLPR